jgi:hypothetical protein
MYPACMDAHSAICDPVTLVRQLDPDVIRRRLMDLGHERSALLVLLRAAQRAHPDGAS